jgi:DNA polymerase-3 subunit beta
MKFSISKDSILEELQLLQGIVEKRNTMPILANILVHVTPKEVVLTGTDLEVGLITRFPAQIEEAGALTVSGKKIFEIVKSLPEGQDVSFREKKDQLVEITSGASEFKVLCQPKDDFPQVPEPKFEKDISLPFDRLKEMIDLVYYAIAQEQRYYLNGALMILKGKTLELVSTDGHRLSYTQTGVDKVKLDKEVRVIVAKKTLSELKKADDETVAFDADENNLFFKVKNRILISRIIESKFPNFDSVIPKDNPHVVVAPRTEFADAIRRVALLSTERSRGIKLKISKKRIELSSSNPEIGEARDVLDVDYGGADLDIGFNAQYLLDFMTAIGSDKVRLELKDENSAAVMRPETDGEVKSLYVIMPMKI